jgi:PEGA domain-containing protein
MVGLTMSRVIAALACGFALAACSMSMPSLDFFRSAPATEVLRVESEPPGADARTTQGQSCRTPCELTVTPGGELAVSFALNGYQPQTLQVRAEPSPDGSPRLQPNPVYAELQSVRPVPTKKKRAPAKKVAKKTSPPPQQPPTNPEPGSSYPWPDPQPR